MEECLTSLHLIRSLSFFTFCWIKCNTLQRRGQICPQRCLLVWYAQKVFDGPALKFEEPRFLLLLAKWNNVLRFSIFTVGKVESEQWRPFRQACSLPFSTAFLCQTKKGKFCVPFNHCSCIIVCVMLILFHSFVANCV